jgi:hypothetical protein
VIECFIEVVKRLESVMELQRSACIKAGIEFRHIALDIGDSKALPMDPNAIAIHLTGQMLFPNVAQAIVAELANETALDEASRDMARHSLEALTWDEFRDRPLSIPWQLNEAESKVFNCAWYSAAIAYDFGLTSLGPRDGFSFLPYGLVNSPLF